MNKQEFVDDLAERCDLSKAAAGRALDAILDSLTEAMADGDEVGFTGFGKFLSQRRKARQGTNPQNPDKKIRIPAATVPKFRPGASLRAAVSDGGTGGGANRTRDAGRSRGASKAPEASGDGLATWTPLASRK